MAEKRRIEEESARRRAEAQFRRQAASMEAGTWTDRLRGLIAATRKRVPWTVDPDLGGEESGFHVRVGTAEIQLELWWDGWHVTRVTHDLYPRTGLPTNPADIREQILERMVHLGLEDLYADRVQPSPDQFSP